MSPAPKKPIVCYVTHRKSLAAGDSAEAVLEKIRAAVAAGVDWVQIREKDLSGRELLALAKAAVGIANTQARENNSCAKRFASNRERPPGRGARRWSRGCSSRPGISQRSGRSALVPRRKRSSRISGGRIVSQPGRSARSPHRRRELHFLRPCFRYAVETRHGPTARRRAPGRNLQQRHNSSDSNRRSKRGKRSGMRSRRSSRNSSDSHVSGAAEHRGHAGCSRTITRRVGLRSGAL